ncbi:acyltransferase [Brucella sp. 21LCYQ03]|nr:acyltransferase [Brucella sp. 21LCYQ03]
MNKNLVIQALRGIAALAVVIFHASALLADLPEDSRRAIYVPMALAGVDLFFLISGYIIAASVSRVQSGWNASSEFMLKRIIRVWPPYAIATAIFCLAYFMKNGEGATFAEIARSLAFIQFDNTPSQYGFAALVVGWTLNYEMFFYVVVAAGLLTRYRWAFILAAFAIALIAIPLLQQPDLSFVQLINAERVDANAWVYTNPLCWLFVAGAAIHYLEQKQLQVKNMYVFSALATVSLAFLMACYLSPSMTRHGLTGMGLAVLPMFMVCVLSRGLIERFVPRWLVYLGDTSFSLYLTHVILLSVVKAALAPFIGEGYVLMTAAVAVSIAVGALYFSIIERPISAFLTSQLKVRSSGPKGAAA